MNRLAIIFLSLTVFSSAALVQEVVLEKGDSVTVEGANFTLLDSTEELVLLQVSFGNTSNIFFAKKNVASNIVGLNVLAQDYQGKTKIFFSRPESSVEPAKDILNKTTPQQEISQACFQGNESGIRIGREAKVFDKNGRTYTLVEYTITNEGEERTEPFVLQDKETGREWTVEPLKSFQER